MSLFEEFDEAALDASEALVEDGALGAGR